MIATLTGDWRFDINEFTIAPPVHISDWLTEPFILSKRMRLLCDDLSVNLLDQSLGEFLEDEVDCFVEADIQDSPIVRQIFLEADKIPWTYARTVIVKQTYANSGATLRDLGDKLLGESVLYKDPNMQRSAFSYARLTPDSKLFQAAIYNLPERYHGFDSLWARRSNFQLTIGPLLVTEVFFNHIKSFKNKIR